MPIKFVIEVVLRLLIQQMLENNKRSLKNILKDRIGVKKRSIEKPNVTLMLREPQKKAKAQADADSGSDIELISDSNANECNDFT